MLSVYFSLITGQSFSRATIQPRSRVLSSTLAFVAGFALVFTAAGAAAGQVGALFQRSLGILNLIGGLFVIALALTMLGVVPRQLLERLTLRHRELEGVPSGPRSWSAFLVGLFFAVACSHCIAPTLYAVLLYAGGTGSAVAGGALMAAFSLGLAIPYVLAGLFLGRAVNLLRRVAGAGPWLQRVAGVLMLALGAIMIAGKLPWLTQVITSVWPYRPPVGM